MPGSDIDAADDGTPKRVKLWDRVRGFVLETADPSDKRSPTDVKVGSIIPTTVAELEEATKRCDDKERLVGLALAPVAAAIGLVITVKLLGDDPSTYLANGQLNKLHVAPSLYLELGGVTFALALAMLVMAWLRKRLYLGIILALYGLSVFNLHFWGFGIPFIMAGAWLLVRAYRLNTKLKLARAAAPGSGSGTNGSTYGPPGASKRYTPPTSPPARPAKPKTGKEPKAG